MYLGTGNKVELRFQVFFIAAQRGRAVAPGIKLRWKIEIFGVMYLFTLNR